MKKEWTITIIIVIVTIITTIVVLYAKTDIFKRIAQAIVWFYNGLKDFNWNN